MLNKAENEPVGFPGRASIDTVTSASKSRILIPEILHRVLENLSKANLTSPALTCRSWSELACNLLWRDIDQLVPILKILAPMSLQGSTWVFEDGLGNANWDRFAKHCNRVRALRCSGEGNIPGVPNGTVTVAKETLFHLVACMPRTQPYIFPHLITFDWCSTISRRCEDIEIVLLLTTPSVRQLGLNLDFGSIATTPIALRILGSISGVFCGQLLGLSVAAGQYHWKDPKTVTRGLALCLNRNPKLLTVTIPNCFPKSDVLQALCSLKDLQELRINFTCFRQDDLPNILNMLVESCPSMKKFHCGLCEDEDESIFDQLRFDILRPLLRWRSLTCLHLEVPTYLFFDSIDVIAMSQAWPRLEKFVVEGGEDGDGERSTGIDQYPPLSIVAIMAQHFPPTLRELSLSVAYLGHPPLTESPIPMFRNLQNLTLHLGDAESVDDEFTVGELLGHLAPVGASVDISVLGEWEDCEDRIRRSMALARRTRRRAVRELCEV